jgi:gliding motility-associated-like protein
VDQVPANMEVVWLHSPTSSVPFHIGEVYNTIPLTGNVSYWVALRDPDGCISSPQRISGVTFWTPHIGFEASATQLSIPNAIVEFTADLRNNPPYILWDFGDGTTSTQTNPVHQYENPGRYTVTLTVIDENGCERVLTKSEYIIVDESVSIWVPSGFTPNGDGLNDEFFVQTQLITGLDITILNRWGQVVFRSDRLDFKWNGFDGDSGKPLPEGVYTWSIQATTYRGYPYNKSGTITLIR